MRACFKYVKYNIPPFPNKNKWCTYELKLRT